VCKQSELKSRIVRLYENSAFAGDQVPSEGPGQTLQSGVSTDNSAGGGTSLPPRGVAPISTRNTFEEIDGTIQLAPGQQFSYERIAAAESFQEVIINRVALLEPCPTGRLQEISDLSFGKGIEALSVCFGDLFAKD